MVIDESMRLYPPAWGISCQALRDNELGGYRLPRGWLALVIPYVRDRLPAYRDHPDVFEPERFSPERRAKRPEFVYLPFGAGPRQCIGNHFVLTEAQLILATLAQRYRLHHVQGHRVEPWPLISLRPRFGMPMTIEQRAGWHVQLLDVRHSIRITVGGDHRIEGVSQVATMQPHGLVAP
jgi:cytochrome P450